MLATQLLSPKVTVQSAASSIKIATPPTEGAIIVGNTVIKKIADKKPSSDPYGIPDVVAEKAAAKIAAAKALADEAAAKAALIDPANPDLSPEWKVLPGKMSSIAMAGSEAKSILVGLDASGKPFKFEADKKTWSPLPTKGISRSPSQNDLKIIKAVYGAFEGWSDVTDRARQFINGQTANIPVNDDTFGDPSPGNNKILQVWWEYNGRKQTSWCGQGGTFGITRDVTNNQFICYGWKSDRLVSGWNGWWKLPEDSNGTFYFQTDARRDIIIGMAPEGGSPWYSFILGGDNNNTMAARVNGNDDIDWARRNGSFPAGNPQDFWVRVDKVNIAFGAGKVAGEHCFYSIPVPAQKLRYFSFTSYKQQPVIHNVRVGDDDNYEVKGMNDGSSRELTFKDLKIAGDGSMAAIASDETIWVLKDSTWMQIPGGATSVSIGSADEVWCVNSTKNVFRKKNPIFSHPDWLMTVQPGISVASLGGGHTVLAGTDQKIYVFNRITTQLGWEFFIKPADLGMGNPLKILLEDSWNIVFLDYEGKVWRLTPGSNPKDKNSWVNITEDLKAKDFCVSYDGTIVIIDSKDRIIRRTLNKDEQKTVETARGEIIYGGQIVSMDGGLNIGSASVWTHAYSPHDPNSTNPPPNNYLEVCAKAATPSDYTPASGSFFMLTQAKDESSNLPIQFGDSINIWSLYAAGTDPKKVGPLSKEWKWWTEGGPNSLNDLMVSLISHPQTKKGQELFQLVSPIGRQGPVHSNDKVKILSLSSEGGGRNREVFWGSPRGEPCTLGCPSGNWRDAWGFSHSPYGEGNFGGQQIFGFKAINQVHDLPDYKNDGKNLTPQEVFGKIAGDFLKKVPDQSKVDKDALVNNHNDGLGVIREVRNDTEFDLDAAEIGIVKPQDAKNGLNRDLITNLTIKGFSKESEIKDFDSGKMIQLDKLWSQGVAWITESLDTPGKATISFLARPSDQGNVQVAFNNSLLPDAKWRIIIGGWNNQTARILHGDQIMAEADAKTTHLAATAPGRFTPYWASINNGFIMVGVGSPGENVFMSCLIPEPESIDRYGFSSHDGNVDYTEVNKSGALQAWADTTPYQANEPDRTLPTGSKSVIWLNAQLRVPNEGTVAFKVQAKHSVSLVLQNDKKENYKVIFGANGNHELRITKGDGKPALQIFTGQTGNGTLYSDRKTRFWVSIQGGRFLIGQGDPGENLLGVWEDQQPLTEVTNIGFETTDHRQIISDLKFYPPVTLGTEQTKSTYDKIVDRFPYKGSVLLIRYFEFQFAQDGQYVSAKDMITGQNFHLIATPQQGARYILRLDIQANGTPSILNLQKPEESPAKIELQRQAALADISAEKLKDQAQGVMNAGASLGQGWSGGSGAGSMIAAAGSLAFAGIGAGVYAAGAENAADAAKKRLEEKLGYRADDSPVYTEVAERAAGLKPGDIPQAAQENRIKITAQNGLLDQARRLSLENAKGFKAKLAIYLDILRCVSHPSVVADKSVKEGIYDALDEFQDTYSKYPDAYPKVMSLFVKAFSNNYLTDSSNQSEADRKDRWYLAILDICTNVFEEAFLKQNFEIDIAELRGEYLWVPRQFADGKGSVTFEARGQNDILVCFAQQDYKVKDPNNNIYEFDFGAWKNTTIETRIRSLGKPAIKISAADNHTYRQLMLNPRRFQSYWINFDNGLVEVGFGKVIGENMFMEWQDPFPWQNTTYIGFGSWNVPVTVRNIELTNATVIAGTADLTAKGVGPSGNEPAPITDVDAENQQLAGDEQQQDHSSIDGQEGSTSTEG